MLKVSGKWLSPKELENCLLEHPAVHEAAVVGAKTAAGLIKPRAFVTLEDGTEATPDLAGALQEWAKGKNADNLGNGKGQNKQENDTMLRHLWNSSPNKNRDGKTNDKRDDDRNA